MCDSLSSKWNVKNHEDMDATTCAGFKKCCGAKTCRSMIDVVQLQVNGTDPLLQAKHAFAKDQPEYKLRQSSSDPAADSKNRYRELGQLKYSLRSLEQNVPWAQRIFIVTNNQVPDWLNVDHP